MNTDWDEDFDAECTRLINLFESGDNDWRDELTEAELRECDDEVFWTAYNSDTDEFDPLDQFAKIREVYAKYYGRVADDLAVKYADGEVERRAEADDLKRDQRRERMGL